MLANLSIRAKLVAGFLLIAFFPLVVLGLLLFQQGKKDILRSTEENLLLSININRKQVDTFIHNGLEHITLLSNLGKMFPLFCYRKEVHWRHRLAVAIGMWPRGEVGAGVLVISLVFYLLGTAILGIDTAVFPLWAGSG